MTAVAPASVYGVFISCVTSASPASPLSVITGAIGENPNNLPEYDVIVPSILPITISRYPSLFISYNIELGAAQSISSSDNSLAISVVHVSLRYT